MARTEMGLWLQRVGTKRVVVGAESHIPEVESHNGFIVCAMRLLEVEAEQGWIHMNIEQFLDLATAVKTQMTEYGRFLLSQAVIGRNVD